MKPQHLPLRLVALGINSLNEVPNSPFNHKRKRPLVCIRSLLECAKQLRVYACRKADLFFGRWERLPGHPGKCNEGGDHVDIENIINVVDMVNLFPVTCQSQIARAVAVLASSLAKRFARRRQVMGKLPNRECFMDRWIIKTECFGYPMYASEVGVGWTDRRDEASVFDERDNQELKLDYFNAAIGLIVPSAACQVEAA